MIIGIFEINNQGHVYNNIQETLSFYMSTRPVKHMTKNYQTYSPLIRGRGKKYTHQYINDLSPQEKRGKIPIFLKLMYKLRPGIYIVSGTQTFPSYSLERENNHEKNL